MLVKIVIKNDRSQMHAAPVFTFEHLNTLRFENSSLTHSR